MSRTKNPSGSAAAAAPETPAAPLTETIEKLHNYARESNRLTSAITALLEASGKIRQEVEFALRGPGFKEFLGGLDFFDKRNERERLLREADKLGEEFEALNAEAAPFVIPLGEARDRELAAAYDALLAEAVAVLTPLVPAKEALAIARGFDRSMELHARIGSWRRHFTGFQPGDYLEYCAQLYVELCRAIPPLRAPAPEQP